MSIGEHCYITWKEEHCRELSVLHYLEGRALPCVITLTGRKSIAKSYYINWKEEHCQELLPRTLPGRKRIAKSYYITWKEKHCLELLQYLEGRALPIIITYLEGRALLRIPV